MLASGDELLILTSRYPNVVTTPDGQTSDENTYLFLSSDGGNSFPDPAEVGTQGVTGDPAIFGEPGATRIGLVSDTETGGAYFQQVTPGRFTRARASLGFDGIWSSAAPVGTSVMLAYTNIAGQESHLRTWTGQGDIHDASTWALQTVPGAVKKLAYGPAGVFALIRSDTNWVVRKVFPGPIGQPVTVDSAAGGGFGEFFEDPSGKLFAMLKTITLDGELVFYRTSTNGGRSWSTRQSLYLSTGGASVGAGDIGATFDDGGVAVLEPFQGPRNQQIQVLRIGPQGPTGRPGLGSLAGGSADPSIVETCRKIKFFEVSIQSPEGCLLGVQGQPGTKVSEGTVRLNGLEVVPDPGVKIIMNARTRTLDTTGVAEVQARTPGISPVVLARGELHLKIPEGGGARAAGGGAQTTTGGCTGRKAFSLDATGAALKGFPIGGRIAVYLDGEASCIPLALQLPNAFGGIRGDAVLRADNERGLHLDSLHIDVRQAYIGPLLLQQLTIDYRASTDEWTGTVDLGLPPQPGGIRLGAGVRFQRGQFKEGTLSFAPPYPGISLDPFAVSYATNFRATFGIDPVKIGGGMAFGILPRPPDGYFFTVVADGAITFGDPVRFDFRGTGLLFGRFQVSEVKGFINGNAQARVEATTGINLGIARVDGGFSAFADARAKVFSASLTGNVCIAVCESGEAVISSEGVGACATVIGPSFGFKYRWGDTLPKIMFIDCDISDYIPQAPPFRGGARAAATSRTFSVASGARVASVRLTGAGGPPSVTLVSPSGQRITPSTDLKAKGAPAYALAVPGASETYVGIVKPAAGTWTVETVAGSPEISELASARLAPPPSVSGKLGGKGRSRTLSYSATTGNGLTTTFFEQGAGGMKQLGTARSSRGVLRFAPGPGPGGKRTIVAVVARDGIPRLRREIASYVAPSPPKPGRVTGVKVRRSGSALVVSWKGTRGAAAYAVRVDLSDGRRLLRVVKGSTVRITGVARDVKASVTVAARGATGRAGAPGRAKV